jgi:hypothetical protein
VTWELDLELRQDGEGLFRRRITLNSDGSLVLDGHDLGPGVQAVLGRDEYEFDRTLSRSGVARLSAALGVVDDAGLRTELQTRFARPGGSRAFEAFLEAESIPSHFWSRAGD